MDSQHTPVSLRAHNLAILGSFLDDGIEVRVRLSGFSMKPLLQSGSVVRIAANIEARVGDIVLLSFASFPSIPGGESSAKLVAHRVVALDEEHVWTKGDSSLAHDPPVARSRVLGSAKCLETRWMTIPLDNAPMRALGLLLSSVYPRLARAYRTMRPRKDAVPCAS